MSAPLFIAGESNAKSKDATLEVNFGWSIHHPSELFHLSIDEVSGPWQLQIEIVLKASN